MLRSRCEHKYKKQPNQCICVCVRPVLHTMFGQDGHCRTSDGPRSTPSAQVGSRCRLGDGANAVPVTNGRLEVCDAAVPSGRWCVDWSFLAGVFTFRLIRLFVRGGFRSLQSGWRKDDITEFDVCYCLTGSSGLERNLPAANWKTFFLSSVRSFRR